MVPLLSLPISSSLRFERMAAFCAALRQRKQRDFGIICAACARSTNIEFTVWARCCHSLHREQVLMLKVRFDLNLNRASHLQRRTAFRPYRQESDTPRQLKTRRRSNAMPVIYLKAGSENASYVSYDRSAMNILSPPQPISLVTIPISTR